MEKIFQEIFSQEARRVSLSAGNEPPEATGNGRPRFTLRLMEGNTRINTLNEKLYSIIRMFFIFERFCRNAVMVVETDLF